MSSEQLADGVNPLDAELAATWDVLKGYSGRDTDLGIARRFGGSAAAYSLRDIGAMNGRVVKVRRDVDGDGTDKEEDFSANQVQDGTLENWVNGKLESTLPADVATAAAAYSLRKVKADYGIPVTEVNGTDGFPATITGSAQTITGTSFTVRHFSNGSPDSSEATAVNGVYRVSATKTSTASFSKAIRIQGLEDGKQYTVKGEFRMVEDTTSGGNSAATVDISDDTAGTDEDAVSTTSTTFVPFFIDSGYNSGSNDNWVDFAVASVGSETGTITAEFRNVQIIENNNSAVRIRRSSDDEEVVVGFDSDNKVSASSSVTATPSGSTTATTLGDFINGTDAFVHTWYDQAGSNNAVQETAANQPKIAENGALLADGLLFDGVNDSFEATDITNVNFPATVVSVSETNKIGSPNTALYSLNNDSNACCGFYRSTSKYAINNGTTTLGGSATYTTGVHRLKFDLFNGASSAGFSNSVSDISGDIGTEVSQVTHFRIAGSLKAGITSPHDGTIKEIILYTSDQSDNRFKIESNINNYYGLYNDANEFASNETAFRFLNERSGGTSASSDLTQFTLDVQTASAYVGAKFSSNVLSGDSIYVSFNCTFDNGSPSPKIALRDVDTVLNGGIDSNEENVTEGFNQFTLTSNSSDASGIVWSEGDDNVIFSVTDFKVSRIARNGFVETWYDQSGNGRDMIQDTATKQPAIVQNGGSVRTANGYHSIQFDGTDDYLNADSYSPAAFATGGLQDFNIQTVVGKPVLSSTNETVASCGSQEGSNAIGGFLLIHKQSTDATLQDVRFHISQGGQSGTHIAQIANINKTTQDTNLLGFSRNSTDDGYILDLNENTSTATNTLYPATKQTGENANFKLGSAMYNSTALKFYSGQILETILFESNKEDDTSDIQNDLNNFYDI